VRIAGAAGGASAARGSASSTDLMKSKMLTSAARLCRLASATAQSM
jgi:hypothetical protein